MLTMTHDEIIAVVTAHRDKKPIEYMDKYDSLGWIRTDNPTWDFANCDYRVAETLCITDKSSHFEWLVKFIEETKQDSLKGSGVAHQASVAVCDAILGYARDIRKQSLW